MEKTVSVIFDNLQSTPFCTCKKAFDYWNKKQGNKEVAQILQKNFIDAKEGTVIELCCDMGERNLLKDFKTSYFILVEKNVGRYTQSFVLEPYNLKSSI